MGTADTPLPGDLRVTVLENNDEGVAQGQPSFAPVAPDGSFSFEVDPQKSYLIGLFFRDVTYSRILEPGEVAEVDLEIFETIRDTAVISVASDSMTILQSTEEGQSDVFEVLQLLRFRNSSDRAFIGTDAEQEETQPDAPPQARRVAKLPLPESAYDISPAGAANAAGLATSGRQLVTTSALMPGETSVAYLFKVKVPRSGWQLRREVYHPTDRTDLLIDKNLVLVAAPGFEFQESRELGEMEYDRWRSGALNPGSVVEADIGFPEGSPNDIWFGFVTVAAVVGALGFGGAIFMRRRRAADKIAVLQAAAESSGEEKKPARQDLIDRVAALDEQFESGEIEEQDYRSRRTKLIQELTGEPEDP